MNRDPPRPMPGPDKERAPTRQPAPPRPVAPKDTPAGSASNGGGSTTGGRKWRNIVIGVAALAIAGVIGIAVLGGGGGDQAPTPLQRAEIDRAWQQVQANRVTLLPIPPGNRDQAYGRLRALGVPPGRVQAIQAEVERGTMELVSFTLWDNVAEDGDIVDLETPDLTVRVPLRHARATIPLVRPASGVVNIRGVHDGGGGITMGIEANGTPVLLPPLQPGQVLGIPVR